MVIKEEICKMKVLFVQPRDLAMTYSPKRPIMGLAILAAILEKENIKVKVLDMRLKDYSTTSHFKSLLKSFQPDVVGFTVAPLTKTYIFELAKIVKNKTSAITLAGGSEVNLLPNKILENEFIDFIIHGEAEYSLPEFLKRYKNNSDWKKTNGLGYKENNKQKINPRKDVEDLNKLPRPSWDHFPLKKYNKNISKIKYPILTSRGCPYKCIYCVAPKTQGKYRMRSAKNVVDEIEWLKDKYKITSFQVSDDNFALDKQRVINICDELINRNLKLKWSICEGFVASHADYQLFKKMKEAGCYLVAIGVESIDPEILKNIKKPSNLEHMKYAFKAAKKAGLITKGFFICGLPGATYEKEMEYIKFFKETDIDIPKFSNTLVYPKTELSDWAKNNSRILVKNMDDIHNQLSQTTGSLKNLDVIDIIYETDDFSKEERIKSYLKCLDEADKWALQKIFGKFPGYIAWHFSKITVIRKIGEKLLDYTNKI
jgi:radical SAM superfamily enzyme YgiQ (UPF0313 family)